MWAFIVRSGYENSFLLPCPIRWLLLLTKVNREDCVDFLASNMKAEVKNRFGKVSELKRLTDDYLFLQTTGSSSMEMKLLPLNDSVKVICVVNTVCGPACDSEVRFYNTDWQQLAKGGFYSASLRRGFFYLPVDTLTDEAYAAIREKADMELVKATLSEDKPIISLLILLRIIWQRRNGEKLVVYIRKEPVVYEWKGGKYNDVS